MNEEKDLIIPCACGEDSFLRFITFDNIEDISGKKEVYVSITGQEIYSLKDKLKAIWNIIRYGSYENFGVIVDQESKDKIKEFFSIKTSNIKIV